MLSGKFTSELRGSSKCWLKFVLAHPKARLQSLQFIMELLYWLLEGGDSEDKEDATGNVEMKNIQRSVFEISCDMFQSRCKGHGKIKVLEWFKYVLDVPVYRR
ncbi:PREDICTED: uncharacterized protein LOC105533446 [Mandrillus leucophaeus]|uniref:uncharacterized protein LOC105533446 n=1 Tax=Mandrillus leucophaeus TaxID=9568 RepID=UPI0005F3CFC0|nr:PREDICTED: uncharacterized protein LOC105533446 [Mandrillus leucophaeus]